MRAEKQKITLTVQEVVPCPQALGTVSVSRQVQPPRLAVPQVSLTHSRSCTFRNITGVSTISSGMRPP